MLVTICLGAILDLEFVWRHLSSDATSTTASPSQAVLLCSMPSVSGRCDLHPLNTVWERCRFRLVEAVTLAACQLEVSCVVSTVSVVCRTTMGVYPPIAGGMHALESKSIRL